METVSAVSCISVYSTERDMWYIVGMAHQGVDTPEDHYALNPSEPDESDKLRVDQLVNCTAGLELPDAGYGSTPTPRWNVFAVLVLIPPLTSSKRQKIFYPMGLIPLDGSGARGTLDSTSLLDQRRWTGSLGALGTVTNDALDFHFAVVSDLAPCHPSDEMVDIAGRGHVVLDILDKGPLWIPGVLGLNGGRVGETG